MSPDIQWDHQFCLGCDRQTDGATYCSESCRLADYEKTSTPSESGPNSPSLSESGQTTLFSNHQSSSKFSLSPAYDFSSRRTTMRNPTWERHIPSGLVSERTLSPTSSHGSLTSLKTNHSTASTDQLSDKARKQLRAYASSFDQVRLQRRRSY